jgi:hypothetical protein
MLMKKCEKLKIDRIGETNTNKQGLKMCIKEYNDSNDIYVEFEDGYIALHKKYHDFENGKVYNKNYPYPKKNYNPNKGVKCELKDRTGEINYNHYGSKMTITEYTNSMNIIVEFENGYKVKSTYADFKRRKIINPYDKMVYGVGYFGEGKYKCSKDKVDTKEYSVWHGIIERCYSEEKQKEKCKSYIGCTVCDEWLNFQKFSEWYEENYYEVDNEKMTVDKDIIYKNNKIYSPETCIIVPENINKLFIKGASRRGEYPIGVSITNNRLRARLKKIIDGKCKEVHIGYFDTVEQAFNAYKREKEKHIKQVADEYKDKIPKKLYDAMYAYKVEITD